MRLPHPGSSRACVSKTLSSPLFTTLRARPAAQCGSGHKPRTIIGTELQFSFNRDMRTLRKIFGWLFAILAIFCLLGWASQLRFAFTQSHAHSIARSIFGEFVASVLMLATMLVFGMAWWTTWKDRPKARAWGLTASVLWLSAPLVNSYLLHHPMTDGKWKLVAVGAVALISYAWPGPEPGPLGATLQNEADVEVDHNI